ncbi:MAG: Mut7-C RNAse domain-containing protein [Dehalococcoidia bacterium]|jgi:uncharacterized protein with PIN domain
MADAPKFIVDHNVGKLARWLRLMGYDARFFAAGDDAEMVKIALDEARIILTRDTQIMKRRLVTKGKLKALLVESDRPLEQIRQVIAAFRLDINFKPFSLCLECNQPLVEREKAELEGLVPPYVYKTQQQFRQCPACGRFYWRGTHWEAMTRRLEGLEKE